METSNLVLIVSSLIGIGGATYIVFDAYKKANSNNVRKLASSTENLHSNKRGRVNSIEEEIGFFPSCVRTVMYMLNTDWFSESKPTARRPNSLDDSDSLFGRIVGKVGSSLEKMDNKLNDRIKEHNPRDVNEFGVDQSKTVKVYYSTCRNFENDGSGKPNYASERSSTTYGYCDVSIPINVHKIGQIERPSIFRLEFRENSSKHITILDMKSLSKDMYYMSMDRDTASNMSESTLMFIHGYNVSHLGAAKRAAQVKYDLDFSGPVTFFSWPSQSRISSYTVDEQTIEWAESHLLDYLKEFLNKSKSQFVYLLAHSMGSRALTRALIKLYQSDPSYKYRVKEVILAAPDIDRDVFVHDIAPKIVSDNLGITLYASSEDHALAASEKIHGATRVGGSDREVAIVRGIESIDATGVDTSFLGHSYFSGSKSVLSDMYSLINHGKRASDRFGLRSVETSIGSYWKFLR